MMHSNHEDLRGAPQDDLSTIDESSSSMQIRSRKNKGKAPEKSETPTQVLKTTVLINNLHCASCVSHIRDILSELRPVPMDISANILTQEVVVTHTVDTSALVICEKLLDEEFEIHSVTTDEEGGFDTHSKRHRGNSRGGSRTSFGGSTRILDLEFRTSTQDGWLERATGRISGSSAHLPLGGHDGSRPSERKGWGRHIDNCDACKAEDKTPERFGEHDSSKVNRGKGKDRSLSELSEERSGRLIPLTRAALKSLKESKELDDEEWQMSSLNSLPRTRGRPSLSSVKATISPRPMGPGRGLSSSWESNDDNSITRPLGPTAPLGPTRPLGPSREKLDRSLETTREKPDKPLEQASGKSGRPLGHTRGKSDGSFVVVVDCLEEKPTSSLPERTGDYEASLSIGGMTCAVCTGAISDGVKELSWVRTIDVNLLTNSAKVVFEGPQSRIDTIVEKINDLGYEGAVEDCSPVKVSRERRKSVKRKDSEESGPETFTGSLSIGGMTCASCTNDITGGLKELPWVQSVQVTLLTNSASVVFEGPRSRINEIVEKVNDMGFECSFTEVSAVKKRMKRAKGTKQTKDAGQNNFTATLGIGGMTCASCVSTVSTGLKELPFIKSVSINLLTNSGTIEFEGREHLNEIVEKVEGLGYDCTVESCVEVNNNCAPSDTGNLEDIERTVAIKIQGMTCDHCPPRILEALRSKYRGNVHVDKPPTFKDPIMRITYKPQLPSFTVRSIISTIADLDDSFTASVYHPPTLEERSRAMQRHEQQRLLLRLVLCVTIAVPTFLIGVLWMSVVKPSDPIRMYFEEPVLAGSVTRADWALLVLATPVMLFAADVFHRRAFKEIRALWRRGSKVPILRRFYRFGSMNLLLSAGTGIAYFASLGTLVGSAVQKKAPMSDHKPSTTYFDTVVFLTMFILLGRFLEAYSKAKTGDAVTSLGKLRPTEAILLHPERSQSSLELKKPSEEIIKRVNVDLLEAGDIVRIPHGSSPPADGVIVSGSSKFDESSLTGESRPVKKSEGDIVFAGTVNNGKVISVKVTGMPGDSMLDQIVKVVREGQTKRAPVERLADVLTGYFVPVITLIAIVTFLVWLSLGLSGAIPDSWRDSSNGWIVWALEFAIAVFVVACPCGIGLAAPTALFVGSGLAAKHGILVKGGGEAFQEASALDVVVFDKTGTLTEGDNPKVTDYYVDAALSDELHERLIWSICQSMEENSNHPIAKAVVGFCETRERLAVHHADVEEVAGNGMRGTFHITEDSRLVQYEAIIGNEAFMNAVGTRLSDTSASKIRKWNRSGKSVAILGIRRIQSRNTRDPLDSDRYILAAQFAITDPLRPEAAFVVKKLQESGIDVWMLSGDNLTTATAVGAEVGIPSSNVIAGVLPEQKAQRIQYLQRTAYKRGSTAKQRESKGSRTRGIVAMVGDGVNDSPALTMADVGIAIGSGSDVAINSAKFVLVGSDLHALITLTTLSRAVFRRVKFNFGWALIYNVAMIPVAAGAFYPISSHGTHIRLNPVWASMAMALSSVSVICSSLLLRSKIPFVGFRPAKNR